MGRIERVAGAAAAVLAVGALAGCQPRQPWSSELASVDAAGDGVGEYSDRAVLSPDGTKVAFETSVADLGPTDTNGLIDVYVRDLTTGTTSLVSVNAAGTDSGDSQSMAPIFSPDGAKVAFVSYSSTLTTEDDDSDWDVFLHDLATGETTRVTVEEPGGPNFRDVLGVSFSPDGGRVAFATDSPGQAYVRDLTSGEVTVVSAGPTGSPGNGPSYGPIFSPDGTTIAFRSEASDLGPTDTNGQPDVYVRDLTTGTTTLVSTDASGTDSGNAVSSEPAFAPDGTQVAFISHATDLGPTDTNARLDVYVRDLAAGTTTLVSANDAATDSGNGHSGIMGTSFSPDGAGLVFASEASNLGPTDTNARDDVYFRDLATGTTTLVSTNADGTDSGNGASAAVAVNPFAPVGRRIAFVSRASDLGPRDANGLADVYVRDLATGVTTVVSATADGTGSANGESVDASGSQPFSADGRKIVFRTDADDLGSADTNDQLDIYVATLHAADLGVTAVASPDPVLSGETVTYQLDVTNAGPDPATVAAAALVLPGDLTVTGVTTTAGTCSPPPPAHPGLVTCDLGDAAVGPIATITVTAEVTLPPGALFSATALVGAATLDDNGRNDAATVGSTVV